MSTPADSEKTRARLIDRLLKRFNRPVLGLDPALRIVAANQPASEALGMEGISLPVPAQVFLGAAAVERIREFFAPPAEISTVCFQAEIDHADGKRDICIKVFRLVDAAGRGLGLGASLSAAVPGGGPQDLFHPDRVRVLGLYSAGVVHEFNNLLFVIAGRASLGLVAEGPGAKSHALENVIRASRRAEHVIKNLLAYVQRRSPEFFLVDLRVPVLEALSLLEIELASAHVEVVRELEKIRPVVCDPVQISQVCFNLLRNAREAMPEGGRIVVNLTEHDGWPVLAVSDNGIGIATEMLQDIFEPFVSYGKPGSLKGFGTGLGLFVAREVVLAHGGDISVRSIVAKGTTFRARIPFMPDYPAAHALARTANSASTFHPL
ncbi:MAG: HAMP domain-containing histidine kinase [Planctomycetes bacterium]|nr:HAMP domain-containing histidine kinase [Planctomycetota bacterium]